MPESAPRILICCGEPSGDLYAGALVREIRRRVPAAEVYGVGGEHVRAAGARLIADFRGLSVTGLAEAVSVLPRSWRILRRILADARATPPDIFIPVDFPDFNLRLAASLRRLGVPIVYYIGPQVWAWRPGRLKTIKRLVDRMLVIFPFEEGLYHEAGVPVEFVGHPLVDLVSVDVPREPFLRGLGLDPGAPTIALLPGSRRNEVRAIWPGLREAARIIGTRRPGVQFVVARAPHLDAVEFGHLERIGERPPATVEGRTNEVLAASDLVLTASGTATVQAALHERPMVIVYRVSRLTYLARHLLLIDTFGMVNLVAGEKVMPELIQDRFTPEAVAGAALEFLTSETRRSQAREHLVRVRQALGRPGASGRAAEAILRVVEAGRS